MSITLTPTTSARLESELSDLVAERAIRASEPLDVCGDAADLAEFAARDMLVEHLDERIASISGLLAEAAVAARQSTPDGRVAEGTVVALRFGRSRTTETFLVGHRLEAVDDVEVITLASPLGRALLGAKPGDKVSYGAPLGAVDVTLVDVRAA
ncbi:MAG TPA: GreA/GreB family elongation factor [Mycobacteriales bacterium]